MKDSDPIPIPTALAVEARYWVICGWKYKRDRGVKIFDFARADQRSTRLTKNRSRQRSRLASPNHNPKMHFIAHLESSESIAPHAAAEGSKLRHVSTDCPSNEHMLYRIVDPLLDR
jgi:hypothetical protein